MKLYMPSLEVSEKEGFSPDKDIFSRKEFGERLANLVEQSDGNLVIALDAKWGEGKSTFIKMWRGHIGHVRDEKIKCIYYDAFANDYQKDPFLALVSEFYDSINDKSEQRKEDFKQKAGNAAKSIARGALKIGVRALSGGLLDGSIVDSAERDFSSLFAEQVDEFIFDRLQNNVEDKQAFTQFRAALEEYAAEEGNGKPVVFIIDELDRCRPDFALELIEQIKHIFAVPNIVFLLVMNRSQLEEAIKCRYGNGVDASSYLQKFINLWLSLPRKMEQHRDHGEIYLDHVIKSMLEEGEEIQNQDTINLLSELARGSKPSFREIEKLAGYFAMLHNMAVNDGYYWHIQLMIGFVSYLKVSKPELVDCIAKDEIDAETLIQKSGIEELLKRDSKLRKISRLRKLIVFDYTPEEERAVLSEADKIIINGDCIEPGVAKKVCRWVSELKISY